MKKYSALLIVLVCSCIAAGAQGAKVYLSAEELPDIMKFLPAPLPI
ncbi:MAG: hypothetical protein J6X63_03665 [Bacteroidales bacterium]|nr:hypothetical protein [Bacteroidales bacterium]